jgi:hypothetical protein
MPLAICQQEVNMKSEKNEFPFLLIVDPSLIFSQFLKVTLRRIGREVEIASFQQTATAISWLSGEMDKKKAAKRPLATPWDEYPALRPPSIAIVSLGFPVDERNGVLDRLYCLSRNTKIITTSTKEELLDQESHWDEVYWTRVVAHLPKPVTVEDVVERVVAVLSL